MQITNKHTDKSEWISVENDLPSFGKAVLIALQRANGSFRVKYGEFIRIDKQGIHFSQYDQHGENDTTYVQYWHPLPAPPNEGHIIPNEKEAALVERGAAAPYEKEPALPNETETISPSRTEVGDITTIQVSVQLHDMLKEMKIIGRETYEDVINRLITKAR